MNGCGLTTRALFPLLALCGEWGGCLVKSVTHVNVNTCVVSVFPVVEFIIVLAVPNDFVIPVAVAPFFNIVISFAVNVLVVFLYLAVIV